MKFSEIHWKAVYFLTVLNLGLTKRYCKQDDDCTELGELFCIKSACEWGVCGCFHGKAAKYLGSQQLYQCVPLQNIGEVCSTDGIDGICAASGSYCHQQDKICMCETGKVPIWGGEKCIASTKTQVTAGETCSPSIGECSLKGRCKSESTGLSDTHWDPVVQQDMPTCACANNEKLVLLNSYLDSGAHVDFLGKQYPTCQHLQVGDMCIRTSDCLHLVNADCLANKCECNNNYVPNYLKSKCLKPLQLGDQCGLTLAVNQPTEEFHCDGTEGFQCDTVCSTETHVPVCVCGYSHTQSDVFNCNPILKGDSCNGDLNCKFFSDNGICVDGKCTDGAALLSMSSLSLLLSTLFTVWIINK